jgi:hypothetical protein
MNKVTFILAFCVAIRVFGIEATASTQAVVRVSVRIFEMPENYPYFDDDASTSTKPVRIMATREIDTIDVGKMFVVKIIVEDIREGEARAGVFSSYVDVNFDWPSRVSLVHDLPFSVHPQTGEPTPYLHNQSDPPKVFGAGAQPDNDAGWIDTDEDGIADQIDHIGSFSGSFTGSGPGEFVLVEWAMRADEPGTLTIGCEPTTENPADDPNDAGESPVFDTLLFGWDVPVCPSQTAGGCSGELTFASDIMAVSSLQCNT